MSFAEGSLLESLTDVTIDNKTQTVEEHPHFSRLSQLTLEDVLQFVTGCREEPGFGWLRKPEIEFDHDTSSSLCRVSTCAFTLTLSVTGDNTSLPVFLYTLSISLLNGGVFSRV